MNVYQRGTAINVVQRFWTIDPLTEASTLADPTTVVFTILSPDNVSTTFTFGVDGNVTHASVGVFVCALDPQLPVGTYRYRCDGTGAVQASSEDFFDVIESGVLEPDPPTVAVTGPCSSWINGEDVYASGPALPGITLDTTFLLDDAAYNASHLLFELSGRQFPGVCQRTVRPCSDPRCWGGSPALGLSIWAWGWASGITPLGLNGYGWWNNEYGPHCGCGYESVVKLGGYPVREILSVKIGGVELPEFDPDSGFRNWRLDGRRDLIRMDDPSTTPLTPEHWPRCQNVSLDDDQPGTFSVKYTWGADVPSLGRLAAAQLARELWNATSGATCLLPTKVTKVVRAGVTLEKVVPTAALLRQGATGLQLVDAFLALVNPGKMLRRPAVFSPDLQKYARKVGQG